MMQPFNTVLVEGRVVVPTQSEADSLHGDGFGRWGKERLLTLEPCEVLYNVERQKIVVIEEVTNKSLSFRELIAIYNYYDPRIWTKFIVYRDLRIRGLVAQCLNESSLDFQVYERGTFKKQPADLNVFIISECKPESVTEVIKRLAEVNEKGVDLKLAVVDRRGEIVYYGLSEKKFI